jgi:hypothetical protein
MVIMKFCQATRHEASAKILERQGRAVEQFQGSDAIVEHGYFQRKIKRRRDHRLDGGLTDFITDQVMQHRYATRDK